MKWYDLLVKEEWNYQSITSDDLLTELKKMNPDFSEGELKDEMGRILQTIEESNVPSQQKETHR